jgi:hypothetical protein
MVVFGAIVFAPVIGVGLFALRQHNRLFPKLGPNRWEPRGTAGWFPTKFTGLSRGRGQEPFPAISGRMNSSRSGQRLARESIFRF